jgi:hypothetical protein
MTTTNRKRKCPVCKAKAVPSEDPLLPMSEFVKTNCQKCNSELVAKARWTLPSALMDEMILNSGTEAILTFGLYFIAMILILPPLWIARGLLTFFQPYRKARS